MALMERELIRERPLEGRLVRLRARDLADEPLLWKWINDPEVTQNLMARYPYSHAAETEWLKTQTAPGYGEAGLGIETLVEGRLIGNIGLHRASAEDRRATLGIMIGEGDFRDRGYGTDAMRTLCRFGFAMMNMRRIELDVLATNPRAFHVYEKVGFQLEGTRREALWKFGRWIDIHMMGLHEGELRWD
ncbi:MAG: GNAT family protein [Dehalococcoidia bacterium]